jgi:hypothetical protein
MLSALQETELEEPLLEDAGEELAAFLRKLCHNDPLERPLGALPF